MILETKAPDMTPAILDLWDTGLFNTWEIAAATRTHEGDVERIIHAARELKRTTEE